MQLKASVSPSSATKKDVTWSSSKSSVASVNASGLVTAVSEGTATITATADGKKGECTVSVSKGYIAVSEVKLNKTELTLYEGEEETLSVIVLPDNTSWEGSVEWNSSDKTIATVEGGKVKAISKGEATITAKASNKTASCKVVVLKHINGISLNKTELGLAVNNSETLIATVSPSDATPVEEIKWSSSDTKVATVVNGKVTALKEGSATITASAEDYKAECIVTVFMQYGKIAITDLKPVDILPIIGQVTEGDKEVYNHIEHLRLAEATRIRDMMWEYGAGGHAKEEYQQLMGRLTTGMMDEYPLGYDNVEIIGDGRFGDEGSGHAHREWFILNTLIKHAHLKVVYTSGKQWYEKLDEYLNDNPNAIAIMGCSSYAEDDRDVFLRWAEAEKVKELCKTGRLVIFKSVGNIRNWYGVFRNKTYHEDVVGDEHGIYGLQSYANGKNDAVADRALLVTVGTNDKGDVDQTDERTSSSRFPVGFHDKALFAGRAFPGRDSQEEAISAEGGLSNHGKYPSSFVNYVNVAMMSICFQMFAEAKDVFEIIDMARATCLTDYIRFNGQTQPLQLINLAGYYKKYLTPQNLPSSISSNENLSLDKGYYKGVLFCIPGAEVKINGEWVAFDNKNKNIILSQNPMNLEWMLNGELIKKYGYTSGQTIEGQIITVDDQWGGLRLEVPMTVQLR